MRSTLPRVRRAHVVLGAGLAAVLAAGGSRAQTSGEQPVNRPSAARRVVQQFGFEPNAREVFELPRYWDMAQDGSRGIGSRPGYPAWNTAALDESLAYAGKGSVKLSTKGGSTCLRLEPGVIPVFPGTDYLVSARVQTRGMPNARAAITARYLDKANTPIAGASIRSELVSTQPDEWKLVTVPLSGAVASAAYIQIDLELLQPERFEQSALDKHQVWPQDYSGAAWFDQVAVVQLPRVSISTASPMNVIRQPERPKVKVMLRDLAGEQLSGVFAIQDAAGEVIDTMTQNLGSGAGSWEWEAKVASLGWYRVTLELRTGEGRVGATYVDLAWLPQAGVETRSRDRERFSIIVRDVPVGQMGTIPGLVQAAGAGAVTIPVWGAGTDPSEVDALCRELAPVVEKLRGAERRISFGMPRLPDALSALVRLEQDHPLDVFAKEEKFWEPYLVPLLDKFGQSVQRWQVGEVDSEPRRDPIAAASLQRLTNALSKLVPGPVIELPWTADAAMPAQPGADVELLVVVPPGASESGVADLTGLWSGGPSAAKCTMVLSGLPSPGYSRLDSSIGLVKQALLIWSARLDRDPPPLALVQPWSWPQVMQTAPTPHAELAAWSNLGERLRDRRAAGRLSPRPGVSCVILAPAPGASGGRTGALALWTDTPASSGATIDLYLGEGPVDIVDIFGNRRSIAPMPLRAGGPTPADGERSQRVPMAHRLPISEAPVFVENVDVDLARFAASFRLDPPFAASSSSEHEISMMLANPWKTRVEGRITVLEPGGLSVDATRRDRSWVITPRTSTFSIGPGETGRVPLLVAFSSVEEAGLKEFLVEVELAGAKDYAPIRLQSALEIGINDFQLDLSYRVVNGSDIAVEAQVTNRGKAPSNYELSGFAEGFPRARASISDLPVGTMATRRFSFPGAAAKLKGQKITVGVQDFATQSRVTRSLVIE